MIYDYVNTKPPMEEVCHGWLKDAAAKAHKYIDRWRGKNGKWYYSYKSKAQELGAKVKRTLNGIDSETPTKYGLTIGDDNGKANSHSGRVNLVYKNPKDRKARFDAGIAAGRNRATKKAIKKGTGYSGSSSHKNLTSKGYSGSKGSGESKRQRNLGTRKVAGSNRYGTTIRVKDPYHKPQFESLSGPGSDGYTFTEPGWYWRTKSLEGISKRQDRNAVKTEVYTVKNKKKKK